MKNKFIVQQLSAIGDKNRNQDFMAYALREHYAVFVVADGLGGHLSGEKASRFFCEGLIRKASVYGNNIHQNPEQIFNDWINAAIYEMARSFGADPTGTHAHTTCAILYINDELVITAHCGDSRIYRMNCEEITWRSKDHSKVQILLDEGEITEDKMGDHPDQNQLTRSISIMKSSAVEINLLSPAQEGETFLLCTDGFWAFSKHYELIGLAQPSSEKDDLEKQAKMVFLRAQGKSDNLTVQRIKIVGQSKPTSK